MFYMSPDLLGVHTYVGVWRAAFESVRIILSVFGFMPAQGEPAECPL